MGGDVSFARAPAGDISSFGIAGSLSRGTSITAHATLTNTKNATFTQLLASTPAAWGGLDIDVAVPAAAQRYLIDIGIGGAGSEVVIVDNLHIDAASANVGAASFRIPMFIPSGTRISTRCQCSSAAQTVTVMGRGYAGTFTGGLGYSQCTTLGADTTDSGGTSLDPGATVDTKGSWTQMTSSAAHRIRWLTMTVGHNASSPPSATWLFDIGIGGAGSEQVIVPDIEVLCITTSPNYLGPRTWSFPVDIAAGTRIAMRCQSNVNTATARLMDTVLYAVG